VIVLAAFAGFLLAIAVGFLLGPPIAVLLLAAVALTGVISFFWSSLRTLLGETPLTGADAYAIGAPRLEEEQKRAVLRALKDLEFERAVGKISEEDYRVLAYRYREEAKRLLRLIDENAAEDRKRALAIVTSKLAEEGLSGGADSTEAPADAAPPAADASRGEDAPPPAKAARIDGEAADDGEADASDGEATAAAAAPSAPETKDATPSKSETEEAATHE
jgi:hypothetical protein